MSGSERPPAGDDIAGASTEQHVSGLEEGEAGD